MSLLVLKLPSGRSVVKRGLSMTTGTDSAGVNFFSSPRLDTRFDRA